MVSLEINGRIRRRWTDSAAGCGGAPLQGRRRHPARGDSDEPDAVRPTLNAAQVVGRGTRSRGQSTRPEMARTKDGAGGGPAEERAWTRGRCTRVLGIEEARTQSEYVMTVLNQSVRCQGIRIPSRPGCLYRDAT